MLYTILSGRHCVNTMKARFSSVLWISRSLPPTVVYLGLLDSLGEPGQASGQASTAQHFFIRLCANLATIQ